jgi:hypothetical protein
LKEKFVSCLSSVLEVRGTQLANLDNCEHSLKIVNSILNRSGIMASAQVDVGPPQESDGDGAVIGTPGGAHTGSRAGTPGASGQNSPMPSAQGQGQSNNNTPQLQRTFTFDHARCQDCSYGYLKTCDCTNHLNALQKQSADANDRLQQLVEMRERVYEEAEKLIQAQGLDSSSLGAGSKSSSGSSFSEMMRGKPESPGSAGPASPNPAAVRSPSPTPERPHKSGGSGNGIPTAPTTPNSSHSGFHSNGTMPPQPPTPSGSSLKAGIAAEGDEASGAEQGGAGRRGQEAHDSVWTEVDGRGK